MYFIIKTDYFPITEDLETLKKIKRAISKLEYNRSFPLSEFYLYNGSLTSPSCLENTTYIVMSKPIYAPISQIQVFLNNQKRKFQKLFENQEIKLGTIETQFQSIIEKYFFTKNQKWIMQKISDLKTLMKK